MNTAGTEHSDPALADYLARSTGCRKRMRRAHEDEVLRLLRHLATMARGNAPLVPGLNACAADIAIPRNLSGLPRGAAHPSQHSARVRWALACCALLIGNVFLVGLHFEFRHELRRASWGDEALVMMLAVLNTIGIGSMVLIWLRGRGDRAMARHYAAGLPASRFPVASEGGNARRWVRLVVLTVAATLYLFAIFSAIVLEAIGLGIFLAILGGVPLLVTLSGRVSSGLSTFKSRVSLMSRGVSVPTGSALNLLALRERLLRGQQLSEAMAALSQVFPPYMAGRVRAAEASGCVSDCLQALGDDYSAEIKSSHAHLARRAYVALVMLICAFFTSFLLIKVVPVMVEVYEDFYSALPWNMKALVSLGDFAVYRWPHVVVVLSSLVVVWLVLSRRIRITRLLISRVALLVPVLGRALRLRQATQAARMLHDLTRAQVPLPEALNTVANAGLSPAFAAAFAGWKTRAEAGASLSECAEGDRIVPKGFAALVRLGEVGDALPEALAHAAEWYDALARRAEQTLQTVAFPIYLAPVAGMVYFVATAFFEMLAGLTDALFNTL